MQDLATAHNQLGTEKIARHTAEQRVLDLNDRLADTERHQESLEETHKDARDALRNYSYGVQGAARTGATPA